MSKLSIKCIFLSVTFLLSFITVAKASDSNINISNEPLQTKIVEPAWFKLSFLDMQSDLEDAKEAKKSGIIIYYGQKRCPYCKKFLEDNFTNNKSVEAYTRKNFDVISINVRGSRTVTGFKGENISERKFAISNQASLTPTIVFYNTEGTPTLKLVGYQNPRKFKTALKFVVDGEYRGKSFSKYLKNSRDKEELSSNDNKQDHCAGKKLAMSEYLNRPVSLENIYCFMSK